MILEWLWGKPLIQNFSNQPQKGYNEITPDAGVPYRKLNFTDIGDVANCTFDLTRIDYIRFMSWYKLECRQGTIPFKIWDCRYKIYRMARIVGDVPQYNTNSNRYTLSLTLYFQPDVIPFDFYLTANDNEYLIVNADDRLVVNQDLRI